jgi:hypothetical protein
MFRSTISWDKAYVGCGAWFAFDDSACGGSSHATLTLPNCIQVTNLNSSDFPLSGCAEITGTVGINGWAGMARTLNPNDRPIDVSQYPALTFFAKGDGKSYRVSIETESVRELNSSDFHQFVFTTSSEWRQFVIPLSSFKQREWDSTKLVPYTGEDVISVAWSSVGDPLESINLSVCGVAFSNSLLINGTTVLADTTDMTCTIAWIVGILSPVCPWLPVAIPSVLQFPGSHWERKCGTTSRRQMPVAM